MLERRLNEVTKGIGAAYGGTVEVDYLRRYPATINTASEAGIARKIAEDMKL